MRTNKATKPVHDLTTNAAIFMGIHVNDSVLQMMFHIECFDGRPECPINSSALPDLYIRARQSWKEVRDGLPDLRR